MTEKQFQIFCKVIYRVTVVTLVLQVAACVMTFWMAWNELPGHRYVEMLLGLSILCSWMLLGAKRTLFNRKEVEMGMWGNNGVMYSLGTNMFWWFCYHFMELVLLVPAIKICVQEIWFS
ncbi:hypothetical protein [Halomonas urumqiensis]|uniref:hypothetical protein n=1 Tax=Halomonas urumqiensis TaxID=1684789 RepID=UPI000D17B7A3|nr:hypothetical protein [Halomonas urumqiensis]PTB02669.1 hypothetical protein C6V82_08470 [Halomonas urumqiensis]GHE21161.1 hypothetical protein GCM10017767_16820 [Halomonas urumqiensis]